jgi:hypothetical protein
MLFEHYKTVPRRLFLAYLRGTIISRGTSLFRSPTHEKPSYKARMTASVDVSERHWAALNGLDFIALILKDVDRRWPNVLAKRCPRLSKDRKDGQ